MKFYKICFVYKSYIMHRLLVCPSDASSSALWRHVQWVYTFCSTEFANNTQNDKTEKEFNILYKQQKIQKLPKYILYRPRKTSNRIYPNTSD
jgi:hypothetical protein